MAFETPNCLAATAPSKAGARERSFKLALGDGVIFIYGGGSPYAAADPFELRLPDKPSVEEAVRLMGVVAGKSWGATPEFLLRRADLILVGQEESAS